MKYGENVFALYEIIYWQIINDRVGIKSKASENLDFVKLDSAEKAIFESGQRSTSGHSLSHHHCHQVALVQRNLSYKINRTLLM